MAKVGVFLLALCCMLQLNYVKSVPGISLQKLIGGRVTEDMCNLTFEKLPILFVVLYDDFAKAHATTLDEMIVTIRLVNRVKLIQQVLIEIGDASVLPDTEKIRNLKGICGAFDQKSIFDLNTPDSNSTKDVNWTDDERKEFLKLHDEFLNQNGPGGIQYTYTKVMCKSLRLYPEN